MFIKCYANSAIFYFLSPFKGSSSAFSAKYGGKNIFGNALWQKLTKGQPFFVNKSFQRND